jgi:catechol 2,3-dioxygenase
MMIKVQNVWHVVLKVRDLERSAQFYRDVLGLKEVARGTFGGPMAFFSATGENHHDIALFEVGPDAAGSGRAPGSGCTTSPFGLARLWRSCEPRKRTLRRRGSGTLRLRDHTVSQSIYLDDPDGNRLELYVDGDPAIWRDDPAEVASVPLEL